MDINAVYNKIKNNNILLFSQHMPGIKAATIEIDNNFGIFINYDDIENSDEEFCVVAHEYGHCVSGSTHKLNSKYDLVCRHEYRADRRAILDFLPIEQIKQAIKHGCKYKYEFAEFLNVPEQFIDRAFEHYKAMELI